MKKQLKSFAFAVLAGAGYHVLCGFCSINQEAASSYTQEMGKFAHKVRLIPHQIPQDVFIMSLTNGALCKPSE